jgi:BASS family bile acid:Na+ symporter
MLKTAVDVTIPVLVFLLMVVVGLELTGDDFRRVGRRFPVVAVATAGQVVLWPLAAAALLAVLPLKPYVAAGIVLVAACPAGGMANFYTHLGRANLALAVALTAASSLAAVLTMPLLLAAFRSRLEELAARKVPIPQMIGQLFLLLILPILAGMLARRAWPVLTRHHGRTLLGLGLVALAALIGLVVVQEWERLVGDFAEISLAVALLTAIIMSTVWAVSWACALPPGDRFSLAMVFAVRNVGVATAVAVTVLGRTEFAVFATAYFLVQTPILFAALGFFRRSQAPLTVRRGDAKGS